MRCSRALSACGRGDSTDGEIRIQEQTGHNLQIGRDGGCPHGRAIHGPHARGGTGMRWRRIAAGHPCRREPCSGMASSASQDIYYSLVSLKHTKFEANDKKNDLLIRALLGGWGVAAGFLSVGKWAVVLSIIVGWHGVVRMIPGVFHFNAFLSLTNGLPRRQWLEQLLVLFDSRLWGSGLQCWSPGLFGWSDGSVHSYVRVRY